MFPDLICYQNAKCKIIVKVQPFNLRRSEVLSFELTKKAQRKFLYKLNVHHHFILYTFFCYLVC